MREDCLGYGINNKVLREILMQYDGTQEMFSFRGELYIHSKAPIKQLIRNNHKHGLRPNEFNKDKDKPRNTGPTPEIIPCHIPKENSVCFEDTYDHIHHIKNHHKKHSPY